MSDCFALLDEPRRPWLDPARLKEKFLALSTTVHPDRVHGGTEAERSTAQERYTQLNAAYQCIREPKARLQHLLELETGAKPAQVQNIPAEMMQLAQTVGQLCRQADAFLTEKRATTSPLLQVQLFERGQQWSEKVSELQRQLQSHQERLEAELKALDAAWDAKASGGSGTREMALKQLEALYRLFSYFGRWSNQLQERLVQLSF